MNGSNNTCIKTNSEGLESVRRWSWWRLVLCWCNFLPWKTTFVTQIADQIAAQGTDVLIFSIEMSRWEIISKKKSISRHTVIESIASNSDIRNAKQHEELPRGVDMQVTAPQRLIWIKKLEKLRSILQKYLHCRRYWLIGVGLIRGNLLKSISAILGKVPVVIDYLQILYPDVRLTENKNTDRSVIELSISWDLKHQWSLSLL